MTVENTGTRSGGSSIEDRRLRGDRRTYTDPDFDAPDRRKGRGRRPTEVPASITNFLEPPDGESFINVPIVISRVEHEFAYMESDAELGRRHVAKMIGEIDAQLGGRKVAGQNERVRYLAEAQNRAVYVRCGDNPGSETDYLSTVVVPGEPIIFEYDSKAHEQASRALLHRFAKALGYKIVEWKTDDQRKGAPVLG